MNEASFTSAFKKKLQENEFYVKKLADRTTRGIPDCFIAKHNRGFFAEIKFVELKKTPFKFTQWSKIKTGKGMVQLTTMVELNHHFLARYIICYRINGKIFFTLILPETMLRGIRKEQEINIAVVNEEAFMFRLHQLLQI